MKYIVGILQKKDEEMELYGSEGKKLRKKDKEAFYYPANSKKLVKIPGMFDSEKDVKKFVEMCVKISIPKASTKDIDEMWATAIARNDIVINAMEELKKENESSGDVWKSRAYGRAVKSLKALKIPIVSGVQVMKISGIGKGIASHIDEILKTGKLKSQEERLESSIKRQAVMEKFLSIWGVGPKHASKWYENGHRDIEDLVNEKLTDMQKVGIKYIEELKIKIPRAEAKSIFDVVRERVKALYPKAKIEMVGSYRRGATEMGDIDIIIYTGIPTQGRLEMEELIADLVENEIITDAPVIGDEKFMGVALDSNGVHHRRMDIRLVPINEWGTALLHSTGPDTFNIQLRQQASQMGYKLSERGLYKLSVQDDGDELIPTPTEASVFEALGTSYVPPEKRS